MPRTSLAYVLLLSSFSLAACTLDFRDPNELDSDRSLLDGVVRDEVFGSPSDDASPELPKATFEVGYELPYASDYRQDLLLTDKQARSLGSNRADAPLSFRRVLRELTGSDEASAGLVSRWLESWEREQFIDRGDGEMIRAGARTKVRDGAVCNWLKATDANQCDYSCKRCAGYTFDMQVAPFHLMAIANRVDLADSACGPTAGEGRLVYTLGRTSTPNGGSVVPFTVILEYRQRGNASDVAKRWRSLLSFREATPARAQAITSLATSFAHGKTAAEDLLTIRTNEAAFGSGWEMRDFRYRVGSDGTHSFQLVPASATPAMVHQGKDALGSFIASNQVTLPPSMRTAVAEIPTSTFRWQASGDANAVKAFSQNTCNGCHGGDRPSDSLPFQHIGLSGGYYGSLDGEVKVSKYLYDASTRSRGERDELSKRAEKAERYAAVDCQKSAPPPSSYQGRFARKPAH
jgi:hypothetical protein